MKRLILGMILVSLMVIGVQAQPEFQFNASYSGYGTVTTNVDNPYEVQAIVTKVVDGDTIDANVTIGNDKVSPGKIIRIRMADINCHEIYGPNADQIGKLASEYTSKQLLNQTIWLDLDDIGEKDQYDRWIAIIYTDGKNFNKELVDLHYADIVDYKDNEFNPAEW